MGDVDDLQNAEEAVAQLQQEREAAEVAALREQLGQGPTPRVNETEVQWIEVDHIDTGFNLRQDPDELQELALSLRRRGQQQPLQVRPHPEQEGRWLLVYGHRRLAALRLIQDVTEQPQQARCTVAEIEAGEHFLRQLLENDHRALQPRDWARGIRMCLETHPDWSAAELAAALGKPKSFIQGYLRQLEGLPPGVLERLESGDLSFSAADLLRRSVSRGQVDAEQAEELAEQVASGERSTSELRQELAPAPKPAATAAGADPVLDDWGDPEATPPWEADLRARAAELAATEGGAAIELPEATGEIEPEVAAPETEAGFVAEPTPEEPEPEPHPEDLLLLERALREWASPEQLAGLGVEAGQEGAYVQRLSSAAALRQLRALTRDWG